MKPEWGQKHECPGCGAHFYDMRKPDATCPKCNAPVNDEAALLAKTSDYDSTPPPKEENKDILAEFEDVETDLEPREGEDDFIEDADDLVGSDEMDMSEVMEHIDEGVADQNL
ncbi:FYDLN acid domain-containing protein [Terasakiella sp. SH-1]|uniref:FYDLN acid domain-containing protein n=1 Tax=Terasakiella sp. SH-1 TaxID=2560057 RepID=UPI001073CF28|nr:FYDLN acid domain-containing protein [Terasakiella sp. SH-1]